MEGDGGVRYFTTEVFRIVRSQNHIFKDIPIESVEPVEEISRTLIENMSKVVFMHSFSSRAIWHAYFNKNSERITVSWKLYLQYIIYAYYRITNGIDEVNERLVSIMSFAANIETFFCGKGHKEFLRHTIDVLCKFFAKEDAKNFFAGGGWTTLEGFLFSNEYLALYNGEYKPMSKAETVRVSDKLKGLLPTFLKDFVPESLERDEIENHEPTQMMIAHVLEHP